MEAAVVARGAERGARIAEAGGGGEARLVDGASAEFIGPRVSTVFFSAV